MKKSTLLLKIVIFSIILLFVLSSVALAGSNTNNGIVKFSGDVHVDEDEIVLGNIVLFSGDAVIEGKVEGDVVAFAGDVTVNGEITGDVVCLGGIINRGPEGSIGGDQVTLASGLNISIVRELPQIGSNILSPFLGLGLRIVSLLSFMVLAVLISVLVPSHIISMGNYLEKNYLRTGLIGILTLVATPIICIALFLTIIGIPLIPLFLVVLVLAGFVGYTGLANKIGEKIVSALGFTWPQPINVVIGILVLWAILKIPVLKLFIFLVLVLLSLGIIIDTKFGTMNSWLPAKKTPSE